MTDESNKLHFNRLHDDMRQQNENISNLTSELAQLSLVFRESLTDNKHRDKKIIDCEENISLLKKDILEIQKQRVDFREEYLPTLDRSKKDHNKKDNWVDKISWFIFVVLLMVVVSSISSGDAKLWFQGNQKVDIKK